MEIDAQTLNNFFGLLSMLILALIAWYNKTRTETTTRIASSAAQTASSNQAMAMVTPGIAAAAGPAAGFVLPRDGRKISDGVGGWWVRINPSPQAASIPDDQAYQAVSPNGNFWSGDKVTVEYLVSDPAAAGWRAKFG